VRSDFAAWRSAWASMKPSGWGRCAPAPAVESTHGSASPSIQSLLRVRATFQLAKEVGTGLGAGQVLLEEVRGQGVQSIECDQPECVATTVWRPRIALFKKTSEIGASARAVFAWHQSPDALRSLIPPWERVEVERAPASLAEGQTAVLALRVGPVKLRWVARHRDFIDRGEEGGEFTDEQVSGPFASWVHRHLVRATEADRCVLEDRIEYTLPGGRLGDLVAGWHVRRKLARMFEYRHQATESAVLGQRNSHGAL